MAIPRMLLVAIDFSEPAEAAFEQALAIAAGTGAEMVLLWVDDRRSATAMSHAALVEDLDRLMTDQHIEIGKRLRALAERAERSGVKASCRIDPGHPDEVIVAVAAEIGCDLIVTGIRGRTGFKRFLLGSVAEIVVRTSPTHVLVVRSRPGPVRRALVATDFSPASELALRLTLALTGAGDDNVGVSPARSEPLAVDLFHAWQFPTGTHGIPDPMLKPDHPLAELRDQLVQHNEARGQALCKRFAGPGRTLRFVQTHGPAAACLQDQLDAEQHGVADAPHYDLVATGTHGYRGFRRFVLGSVAEATVRHAPCSVLVAHAEVAGGGEPSDA
ncbi:MAG: universal stress protein [Haliangiales bacterium]